MCKVGKALVSIILVANEHGTCIVCGSPAPLATDNSRSRECKNCGWTFRWDNAVARESVPWRWIGEHLEDPFVRESGFAGLYRLVEKAGSKKHPQLEREADF